MALPNEHTEYTADIVEDPTTDGASSSGPSLEIDVRPPLGAVFLD
jgi:hypothetical protein